MDDKERQEKRREVMERYGIPLVTAPSFSMQSFDEVWSRVKRRVMVESTVMAVATGLVAWVMIGTQTPGWILALAILGVGRIVTDLVRWASDSIHTLRKG